MRGMFVSALSCQQPCGVFRAIARPPPGSAVLPHRFAIGEKTSAAPLSPPCRQAWGSTPEGGGGRTAEPGGTGSGLTL
jgi:hypothetical protein